MRAEDARKTYGDADPSRFGWQVTQGNLVGSDTLAGSVTRAAGENAGTYALDASGLSNGNYALTFVDGVLTIDKAVLTVTANDDRKLADGRPYAGGNGVTYQGFVADEDASVLGGELVYGGSAQGAVQAGEYRIAAGGLDATNYALDYRDGTLAIVARPMDGLQVGDIRRQLEQQWAALLPAVAPTAEAGFTGARLEGLPLMIAAEFIRAEQ